MEIKIVKQLAKISLAVLFVIFLASCENPLFVDITGLYLVRFETNCDTAIDSYRTKKVDSIPALQKTDAEFMGWYTNASFSGGAISLPFELAEDTTLYAKWNQKYAVRFETGGGTEIASYKTALIAESPDTSREGYYFAGWYEQSDFGGEAVTFPYAPTHATTLYAKWLKIYTVTFETNGGTEIDARQCAVLEKSPETKNEGFKFAGWFKESALQNLVSFPYTLKGDTTLYAKWIDAQTSIYKIEHYLQNTDLATYKLIQTEQMYGEAGKQTAASAGAYDGFHSKSFVQATIAEDDSTVVKIYYDRNSYTVTFSPNGGVGNIATQTYYYGVAQALVKNSYTKPGYTFWGWATAADGNADYADKAEFSTANDVTLYAIWGAAPVNYTVKHYKQNKSLNGYELAESETLTAQTGSTSNATAKVYTGFVAKTIDQQTVAGSGGTTIAVYYDRKSYTVTFDANGGAGTMEAQIFYYEVPQALSVNAFTKTGCSFVGWTTSSDGEKIYADGDSVTPLADVTLYAKWFYGATVSTSNLSSLDLKDVSGAYTIKVTGAITQSTLVSLAEKMANAGTSASITLDLSGTTGLVSISSASDNTSVFVNCSQLTSVILPSSLTTIGSYAFYNCKSITNVDIPSSVKTIGTYAFAGNYNKAPSITSIELDGIETIGSDAFQYCKNLKSITLKNITTIGSFAFYNTGVENLDAENIGTLGSYAFYNCTALTSAKLSKITTVNSYSFSGCSILSSLTLDDIEDISHSAFVNCSALSYVMIDAKTVGQSAFKDCTSLSAVTIGKNVIALNGATDSAVFEGCSALTSVTFLDTNGWYCEYSSTYSPLLDVTNAATNASNLKGYSGDHKWYKK